MTIARRFHRVGNVATRYYMAESALIAYLDVMHGNGMCRFLTVTVSTRLW